MEDGAARLQPGEAFFALTRAVDDWQKQQANEMLANSFSFARQ
jgi:hypothetical protein